MFGAQDASSTANTDDTGPHTFSSSTNCCVLTGAVGSMLGCPDATANTADSGPHTCSSSREELLHGVSRSVQDRLLCSAGAVGSMFGAPGAAANTADSGPHTFNSSREELLHGARQPEVRGKGGVRSAAEIRSAYGRSSTRYSDVPL